MSETVQTQAANGHNSIALPLDNLEQVIGYSGGKPSTFTVVYQGITYVQTFTRDGSGNVTVISQWVPQP
jgi:hypothetical protein